MLQMLVGDKHSSLLGPFKSHEENGSVVTTAPGHYEFSPHFCHIPPQGLFLFCFEVLLAAERKYPLDLSRSPSRGCIFGCVQPLL
jgi:hypothetical protein